MSDPNPELETGDFSPARPLLVDVGVTLTRVRVPTDRAETLASRHDGIAPDLPALGARRAVPGFEIVREVGRGGMGVVFEATEFALNRPVAIKMLIAEQFSTTEDLIRFRLEAEVAARVSHPNVVRVYGSGAHAGQPYLVLEWVNGGTLADAIAGDALPPATAARLVEVLARAVHAAHANGVVHRDLKPNNVLLARADAHTLSSSGGATGAVTLDLGGAPTLVVPKVTDFGLAKLMVGASGLTDTGRVMGTPDYMAPEQAEGRVAAIGPATDVHALGVILYQLLTGRTPFHAETAVATIRRVTDEEPTPPRALRAKVPRDLDTVCLKCLHKQPAKRYVTAAELADDLAAYLDGRPVKARPVGSVERARMWAARRPAVAALMAVVVLLFVGGFTGVAGAWYRTDVQKRRAEAAEADARKAAATADAVNRFLVADMLASAAPEKAQGRAVTVADVLQDASLRVGTAFPDQPEVEAGVRVAIGRSYRSLGRPADALPHLDRALAVRRDALGPQHRDTLRAACEHALVLDDLGRWGEAEAALRQAAADAAQFGEDDPIALDLRGALALSLHTHGRTAEAEPMLSGVLAARERSLGPDHPDTLRGMNDLAVLYYAQARLAVADRLFTDCFTRRIATLGSTHPDTLEAMNNLAAVRQAQKKWDEARTLLVEVVETSRRVRGPTHPDTLTAVSNLARLSFARGKPKEARPLYEQAYRTARDTLGPENPLTLKFRHNLGTTDFQLGDDEMALDTLAAVLAARRRVLPTGHPDLCQSLTDVGIALAGTGDRAGAVAHLREAFGVIRSSKGLTDPAIAKAALTFAEVCRVGRKPAELDEADRVLGEVIDGESQSGLRAADLFDARGRIAEARGQPAAAREYARRAADVRVRRASADVP